MAVSAGPNFKSIFSETCTTSQSCYTADFSHPNSILSQCQLQQSVILSHFTRASRILCPDPCHPDSLCLLLCSGDGWTRSSGPGRSAELSPALSSPWNPQKWGFTLSWSFSVADLMPLGSSLLAGGHNVWQKSRKLQMKKHITFISRWDVHNAAIIDTTNCPSIY